MQKQSHFNPENISPGQTQTETYHGKRNLRSPFSTENKITAQRLEDVDIMHALPLPVDAALFPFPKKVGENSS